MRIGTDCWCLGLVLFALAGHAADNQPGAVARALQHADGNGDGQVTFDELRAVRPNTTPHHFRQYDVNGDKVWSTADVPVPEKRLLERDGLLSKAEAEMLVPDITDELFDLLDRDDDGVLSDADRMGEEQDARTRQQLHDADLNRDGKVSWDEARQRVEGMTEERFKRLDRTGDGYLTQADRAGDRAALKKRLDDADKDGNKHVSFDEARAAFPGLSKSKFDRLDRNGDGTISVEDRYQGIWDVRDGAGSVRANAADKALSADVDGDGKVTYEELISVKPGYPRESFDRIDANGDGAVTKQEARGAK